MSLLGVLNVGGSALIAQQAALQVTGNNLANAADPNYAVEVANLSPTEDIQTAGGLVGTGVSLTSITRQVSQSLQQSLNSAYSDQYASNTLQSWSGQVQSVFNALSGNSLSDQLNTFFNDWSTLANNPSDSGQRQVVVQDGQNVAQSINTLASNLTSLSTTVQGAIGQGVQQVNQLTGQIATLNQQIVSATGGGAGQPNSLLDQRDADLQQLSQLVNIQTATQPNDSVNVYLGSETLVSGATSQDLTSTNVSNNGRIDTEVQFQDGSTANITGGSVGGLFQSQKLIDTTANSVDSLASNLIGSLNQIYSSGQGLEGYTSVTATNAVADPTQPLSSASSDLPAAPTSGSFVITQTDTTTGLGSSTLVPIYGNGAATPTTLNSLAATLNGISGIQATISNGKLQISSTDPNSQITFSQDSSGVLSALGINTFFSGTDATNIAVNSQVASNASYLAAAANGNPDDNTTALAIANLSTAPQSGLNGQSLSNAYDGLVQNIGSAASNASQDATTNTAVQETLTAQQQNISGVSTDQEAMNMIIQQRSYESAAELISTVNQMLQTLLAIT